MAFFWFSFLLNICCVLEAIPDCWIWKFEIVLLFNYLANRETYEAYVLNIKCMFNFFLQLFSLREYLARYAPKRGVFLIFVRVQFQVKFIRIDFFFVKFCSIKFHETPSGSSKAEINSQRDTRPELRTSISCMSHKKCEHSLGNFECFESLQWIFYVSLETFQHKKQPHEMMIIIFWEMTPCGSYKNLICRWVATRCHLPEDDNHHSHRRGNLKSYNLTKSWNKNKNFSLCIHNFYTSNDHQYTKFVMTSELMRTDCTCSITKEATVLEMTVHSIVSNLSSK
jgi:hypothetical protein